MNFISKRQNIYCPVCKKEGYLGERVDKDWFVARCPDCRATYYFPPYKTIPTKVVTDKQERNKCHCGACKDRDG